MHDVVQRPADAGDAHPDHLGRRDERADGRRDHDGGPAHCGDVHGDRSVDTGATTKVVGGQENLVDNPTTGAGGDARTGTYEIPLYEAGRGKAVLSKATCYASV